MGTACHTHGAARAVAFCLACGEPVCDPCRRLDADGTSRCPACAGEADDTFSEEQPVGRQPGGGSDEPVGRQPGGVSINPKPNDPPPGEAAAESAPEVADTVTLSGTPRPRGQDLGPPSGPQLRIPPGMNPAQVAAMRAAVATPLAWDAPESHAALPALFLTLFALVRSPLLGVLRIPWEQRDYVSPLVLYTVSGIVGQVGMLLIALAISDAGALEAALGPHFEPFGVPPVAGALLSVTALPLLLTIRLAATSAISHASLRLIGATTRPFEATFRIYAYSGVAALLALLPGLGGLLSSSMSLLLVLIGLRIAHRATPMQALIGAIPFLLGLIADLGPILGST